MQGKLRSQKGETLTETLVGVLLVALASVVLAAMIGAACRMNIKAKVRDEALYAEITAAESRTGGETGSVTVKVDGTEEKSVQVKYYGAEGKLRSYAYRK